MDNREQRHRATLAGRRDERAGGLDIRKLGALLVLVLLMADLLTRQIGLLVHSTREPAPGTATTNFFKFQLGDFRAELQWDSITKPE
ncbi:MAG: hypothetical protein ABI640_09510 [Gammaproteobacteria bacterium]